MNGFKQAWIFFGISAWAGMMLVAGGAMASDPAEQPPVVIEEIEVADAQAQPRRVQVTGSRIYRDADSVRTVGRTLTGTSHAVTVYSREDLEGTGRLTADALRMLDPRFR